MKKYGKWSRVCKFRMEEEMRKCKYRMNKERKCKMCGYERGSHVLERCVGGSEEKKGIEEWVKWILDKNGQFGT